MKCNAPHPKNVPGPFYVVEGCCISCMAPHSAAPEMMGYDDDESHCFVARQPLTPDEVTRAIRAVWASDVQCLRYGGADPDILRRLAEIGEDEACDREPPEGAGFVLRNHVSFGAATNFDQQEITAALRQYLFPNDQRAEDFRMTPIAPDGSELRFSISWFRNTFHALWVGPGEPETSRWLIHHSPVPRIGSISISLQLDDWLRSDPAFREVRWYTAEQWKSQSSWQPLPY